jgi:hypothetical protein
MSEYTKEQLIIESRELGYPVSEKKFERWVDWGLLDTATPVGRQRGAGVGRFWPERQRKLFLCLVEQHEAHSIRVLGNIPIFIWLWWGEDYIPIWQARRLMENFTRARSPRNWARQIVSDFARPGADTGAKFRLTDRLTQYAGEYTRDLVKSSRFNRSIEKESLFQNLLNEIQELLIEVVGSSNTTELTDGSRVFTLLAVRWYFMDHFGELNDNDFRKARLIYLRSKNSYIVEYSRLVTDTRFGKLHEFPTLQNLVLNAVGDLRTVLSMNMMFPDEANRLSDPFKNV